MNVRTRTLQKSLFEYIVYFNIEHHDVGWLLFPVDFLSLQELINNQRKNHTKTLSFYKASIRFSRIAFFNCNIHLQNQWFDHDGILKNWPHSIYKHTTCNNHSQNLIYIIIIISRTLEWIFPQMSNLWGCQTKSRAHSYENLWLNEKEKIHSILPTRFVTNRHSIQRTKNKVLDLVNVNISHSTN